MTAKVYWLAQHGLASRWQKTENRPYVAAIGDGHQGEAILAYPRKKRASHPSQVPDQLTLEELDTMTGGLAAGMNKHDE